MLKIKFLLRTRTGILLGLALSIIFGFIYLQILHASGTLFYFFVGLAFLLGPVVAGIIDSRISSTHKLRIFLTSSGVVFSSVFVLFLLIYAFLIRLYTTKVSLPAYCDGTYAQANIPSNLEYALPDNAKGILINSDNSTAVVATFDYDQLAHPSTLFLINIKSGNILRRFYLPDDNMAVAMDNSTVYLFNKGIGLFVNKFTGENEDYFLTMDTYGTNELGYFETSGIISSWSRKGSVKSLSHISFNGIVQGCYILAITKEVIKL